MNSIIWVVDARCKSTANDVFDIYSEGLEEPMP